MEIKTHDIYRHEIVKFLDGRCNHGVELGVAEGVFAKRMLDSGVFEFYYGVDMYCDRSHDTNEYKRMLKNVKELFNPHFSLYRMRFDEAVELFPDESLDFVYVDGYAHTGEEGGQTMFDWWPKIKKGGMMAGDDYDEKTWPLVPKSVDSFCEIIGIDTLNVTTKRETNKWSQYPTWFVFK